MAHQLLYYDHEFERYFMTIYDNAMLLRAQLVGGLPLLRKTDQKRLQREVLLDFVCPSIS